MVGRRHLALCSILNACADMRTDAVEVLAVEIAHISGRNEMPSRTEMVWGGFYSCPSGRPPEDREQLRRARSLDKFLPTGDSSSRWTAELAAKTKSNVAVSLGFGEEFRINRASKPNDILLKACSCLTGDPTGTLNYSKGSILHPCRVRQMTLPVLEAWHPRLGFDSQTRERFVVSLET